MPHTGKPIRVLIVHDHKIIRDGLRDLISSRRGMTVVGDAGNRAEALRLAASGQPHIVVLDIDLALCAATPDRPAANSAGHAESLPPELFNCIKYRTP
ncbi:MAG: response regulator [Acidobacteriota bacterium]|nr:response regulator [Acidobacteriota bacterium]